MQATVGREAVVIGAGMGGLAAAKALSAHFDHVTVLERDELPSQPEARSGTPQSRHPHALLLSGQQSLEELFPGFADELERAGALKLRVGRDVWFERPGFDPYPVRDLGYDNFFMSRPLLELVCRRLAESRDKITLLGGCRVLEIVAAPERRAVEAVSYVGADGQASTIFCDLVVDASGRGALTTALLERLGFDTPEATEIGIDIGYSTAVFEIPEDAPTSWKGVFTLPRPPESSRGGFLLPIENQRWIVGLGGRHGDKPPGDMEGYMEFLRGLRTRTIYDAVKNAKRIGEISRFVVPASVRRRFETMPHFPRGLIPLGDAVCRFNPIFGQGMSVAAQEAHLLHRLLAQRRGLPHPLEGLAEVFFQEIQPLLATPWSVAESDFVHPETRGERPADLDRRLQYGAALLRLGAEDPAVHKTMVEVNMLLKPGSALREPQIASRVAELMSAPS